MPQIEPEYKACFVIMIGGELRRTPNTVPDNEDLSTWYGCSTIESVCLNKTAGYPCDHPEEGVEILAHDPRDGSITWENAMGDKHRPLPRTGESTLFTTRTQDSRPVSVITSTGGWIKSEIKSDDCPDLWPDFGGDDDVEEQGDDGGVMTPTDRPLIVGRSPYVVR